MNMGIMSMEDIGMNSGTSRLDMVARLGLARVSLCGAAHLGMVARLDMVGHLGLEVQGSRRRLSFLRAWRYQICAAGASARATYAWV